MKHPVLKVIRANAILFAAAVFVAESVCLAWLFLLGKPELISTLSIRLTILTIACGLWYFVKLEARAAFDLAQARGHVVWLPNDMRAVRPCISEACRVAWLVQLHMEASTFRRRRDAVVHHST